MAADRLKMLKINRIVHNTYQSQSIDNTHHSFFKNKRILRSQKYNLRKRQLGSLDIYPIMVYTSSSQTEEDFLYDNGIDPKAEGDM